MGFIEWKDDRKELTKLSSDLKVSIKTSLNDVRFLENLVNEIETTEDIIIIYSAWMDIYRKLSRTVHSIQNLNIYSMSCLTTLTIGKLETEINYKSSDLQTLNEILRDFEKVVSAFVQVKDAFLLSKISDYYCPSRSTLGTQNNAKTVGDNEVHIENENSANSMSQYCTISMKNSKMATTCLTETCKIIYDIRCKVIAVTEEIADTNNNLRSMVSWDWNQGINGTKVERYSVSSCTKCFGNFKRNHLNLGIIDKNGRSLNLKRPNILLGISLITIFVCCSVLLVMTQ